MIIKRTIRYASYLMAFFGLTAVAACSDDKESDLCYDCEGDIYGYNFDETLCYSDYKDDYSKEEFIEYIEDFEDAGLDCTKK